MSNIDPNWSNSEAIAWIKTLKLPKKHEALILDGMKENEFDGDDLLGMATPDEIKANFSVLPAVARKLFKKIEAARPKKKKKENSVNDLINNAPSRPQYDTDSESDEKVNFPEPDDTDDEGDSYKFPVIFVDGGDSSIVGPFTENHKFSTILNALKDKEAWNLSGKIEYLNSGKPIPDGQFNKTLSQLGIHKSKRNNVMIQIVHGMVGGSKIKNNNNKKKKKKIRRQFTKDMFKKYKHLKKMMTFDKDIISLDDSKNKLRAKMPCGHSVSPKSMFNWVVATLTTKNSTKIKCPMPKCKKVWDFELCSIVACMTEEEYLKYKKVIHDRLTPQLKKCPSCKKQVRRPKNLTMLRVNCGKGCQDFCFSCLNKWNSSSMTVCGNKICATYAINDRLQNCDKVKLRNSDGSDMGYNVEIPEYRSCVYCLKLIKYTDQCKHMTCQDCGKHFCFSCLQKSKDAYSYTCDGAFDQCPDPNTGKPGYIAPRQVL